MVASSAAGSRQDDWPPKYGHLEELLGRPHGVALAVALTKEAAADPAIVLYLGAGATALLFGAAMYFVGRLHGRPRSRRDPLPPDDRQ